MCLLSGYRQVTRTADSWNDEESLLYQAPWSSIAKLLETRKSAAGVGNRLERVVLMTSLGHAQTQPKRTFSRLERRGRGQEVSEENGRVKND